ncbi:hypothetical protein EH31_02425 [Erythrobacter longus]|uniref:AB hydrolase-1 domain-containing protein n=1 Tax=Erythrobacter longus TaxID=1044 RepID=A0A074MI50_ERYLO|nr:alpha/beta hydrolase [Erythrobacter longus]KEO91543.1 hypothetical protein EH31_02425 [Erythrobacter longus]
MSDARPPSLALLLRELPWLPLIAASRFRRADKVDLAGDLGDQSPPVVVFPGLLSHDSSTSLLRRTFSASGFAAYPSGLGFVTGVTPERLEKGYRRLEEVCDIHGEPAIILGWSLGGIYARVLAQRHPELAKMVVTLGTPFSGNRRANNAWRIYNALNDHTVDAPRLADDFSAKPPVHTVAVYSRTDGVVPPECAWGMEHERDAAHCLDVSHMAFGSGRRAAQAVTRIVSSELVKVQPPTSAVST